MIWHPSAEGGTVSSAQHCDVLRVLDDLQIALAGEDRERATEIVDHAPALVSNVAWSDVLKEALSGLRKPIRLGWFHEGLLRAHLLRRQVRDGELWPLRDPATGAPEDYETTTSTLSL